MTAARFSPSRSMSVLRPTRSALISQINTDLGAFGTAAIGADGQLDITLAAADQGIAIAEGDSSIRGHRRRRPRARLRLFALFRPERPFGERRSEGDRPRGSSRARGRSGAAGLGKARRRNPACSRHVLTATLGGPGDNRGAKGLAEALAGRLTRCWHAASCRQERPILAPMPRRSSRSPPWRPRGRRRQARSDVALSRCRQFQG